MTDILWGQTSILRSGTKIPAGVFILNQYEMENSSQIDNKKLQKIITLRMTNEDYNALMSISKDKHSNISKTIRSIVSVVIDLIKE